MFLLLLFPFLQCQLDYSEVKRLNREGDFSSSLVILEKIRKQIPYGEYAFWMAANHASLNHKKEAQKWAEEVVDSFDKVPLRYKEVAKQILYETEQWKQYEEDLNDIYREMKTVKHRLANAKAGLQTQKAQADILRRLDLLIKKKEDEANASKQAAQAAASPKGEQSKKASPLDESFLPSGAGKGEVDMKKFKEYASTWGKLPPKQREAAMIELTRSMPPKYRAAIESYFKKLEKREVSR